MVMERLHDAFHGGEDNKYLATTRARRKLKFHSFLHCIYGVEEACHALRGDCLLVAQIARVFWLSWRMFQLQLPSPRGECCITDQYSFRLEWMLLGGQ
jgi:hypothetical protein